MSCEKLNFLSKNSPQYVTASPKHIQTSTKNAPIKCNTFFCPAGLNHGCLKINNFLRGGNKMHMHTPTPIYYVFLYTHTYTHTLRGQQALDVC